MGRKKMVPADTPQGREDQLISLAFDLVEQRLLDGSATAQETVTLLKLGTQRGRLEQEKIQNENLLMAARVEDLSEGKRVGTLVEAALAAFKTYSGNDDPEDEEEEGFLGLF